MNQTEAQNAQRPIHEIRMGTIRAVIWENSGARGSFCNVSVYRVYRLGEEWKKSTSFGRDDLLVVSKALDRAHSWIIDRPRESGEVE